MLIHKCRWAERGRVCAALPGLFSSLWSLCGRKNFKTAFFSPRKKKLMLNHDLMQRHCILICIFWWSFHNTWYICSIGCLHEVEGCTPPLPAWPPALQGEGRRLGAAQPPPALSFLCRLHHLHQHRRPGPPGQRQWWRQWRGGRRHCRTGGTIAIIWQIDIKGAAAAGGGL